MSQHNKNLKNHLPLSVSDIDESVRLEKTRLLYSNTPINLASSLLGAALFAYGQYQFIEHSLILNWILLLLGIVLIRIGFYVAYKITPHPKEARWKILFIIGSFVTAIIWAGAIYFLTAEDNLVSHIMTAAIIMAAAAGSISALSYMKVTGIGFISILMFPLIIKTLATENEYTLYFGLLYMLFSVILFITSLKINKNITENIKLGYKSINDAAIVHAVTEQSEQANTVKSIFLSSMSHELRTPMNAIMGFTQLMQIDAKKTLTDDQVHNLSEIMSASEYLLTLIDDILELSHLASGSLESKPTTIVIDDVINETVPLVFHLIKLKNINLTIDDNEKNISAYTDFSLLRKILFNLLSNAIKYNRQDGQVIVTTEDIGDKVKISVVDTGKGISENDISQLFKPFNHLDIKRNVNGVGIGLSLTKRMIDVMGGEIGVESILGEGSTFWVTIPKSKGVAIQGT